MIVWLAPHRQKKMEEQTQIQQKRNLPRCQISNIWRKRPRGGGREVAKATSVARHDHCMPPWSALPQLAQAAQTAAAAAVQTAISFCRPGPAAVPSAARTETAATAAAATAAAATVIGTAAMAEGRAPQAQAQLPGAVHHNRFPFGHRWCFSSLLRSGSATLGGILRILLLDLCPSTSCPCCDGDIERASVGWA